MGAGVSSPKLPRRFRVDRQLNFPEPILTGGYAQAVSKDWIEWHRAYDDPTSSLSARQRDVAELIRVALDAAPTGEIRVLSLCSGDAGDLVLALADHPRRGDLSGCVVELNADLAERARERLATIGSALEVRCADASTVKNFADSLPVDLLLLVGIFGNISDADIQRTIEAVPSMCRSGATVIWSRHRRAPDFTPTIREWFGQVGCVEQAFLSPMAGSHATSSAKVTRADQSPIPEILFSFRENLW